MKKKVIIVSSLVIVGVISAFGFVNRPTNNNSCVELEKDSNKIALTAIGINGGLFDGSLPDVDPRSQLFYSVQGKSFRTNTQQSYSRSITQEKLGKAKLIDDLIENYPNSWIKDYRLVDIAVNTNGKLTKIEGASNVLTQEQLNLLKSATIASDIVISVHYNKKNDNDKVEIRQMNVSMVVVPEIQAEYVGGYDKMIAYLKENSFHEINAKKYDGLPQPSISFIINEQGETENVLLTQTSSNTEIDNLLIKLVENMPKWNPAKNAKGVTVKQEFVFNVGTGGC